MRSKLSLWEQAIASLPEADQKEFDFNEPDLLKTLNAVLNATKQVRDTCYQKMWKFKWRGEAVVLRDVADKTILWVNKFKEMGNMIAQCDPIFLATPWAPIKFVMEVVRHQHLIQNPVSDQPKDVSEGQREISIDDYWY